MTCPRVRSQLQAMDCIDPGLIKRVRGTAMSCQLVSHAHTARMAFSAKGLLHRLLPDVWIHTDNSVTVEDDDGRRRVITLVGEDEADPSARRYNWACPLGRALLGAAVGDDLAWSYGNECLAAITARYAMVKP